MTKRTETQTIILSAGAQRPESIALPLPKGVHGAVAKMVVTKMIANGWLAEVEADMHRCDPIWPETGDGHGTTLVVTEAGLQAVGIEPVVANAFINALKAKSKIVPKPEPVISIQPVTIRAGTKQAQIITMLQRPEGATIAEIVEVTSWQAHSVMGGVSKPCWFVLCSCAPVRYAEASEARGDPPCPASIRPNSAACLPA